MEITAKKTDPMKRYAVGMKAKAETHVDGREAWTRFEGVMRKVLSVPREEMLRREAEYRKQVDANPHRRGPKRRVKPSA
jgi:hypothetical protein